MWVTAIFDKLRYYLTRPSWLSEVASGVATVIWGVLAFQIADRDLGWPSVYLFEELNITFMWAILATVLGVGQLGVFELIDKEWSKPWLRFGGAIIAAWLWGAITIGSAHSTPWPPAMGACFGFWFVNVYLIARIFARS